MDFAVLRLTLCVYWTARLHTGVRVTARSFNSSTLYDILQINENKRENIIDKINKLRRNKKKEKKTARNTCRCVAKFNSIFLFLFNDFIFIFNSFNIFIQLLFFHSKISILYPKAECLCNNEILIQ